MVYSEKKMTDLEELVFLARALGATDAKAIVTSEISVKEHLARHCLEPGCENYGLSMSCPPHVSGPSGFRQLQNALKHAVVIRIEVAAAALFSDERWEVFRMLHELVAAVELAAVKMGYVQSEAFAGGSCKKVFCRDRADCSAVSKSGKCRHPRHARPSMSGFGIDVAELMKSCGWPADIAVQDADAMSWIAGLVLIGPDPQ